MNLILLEAVELGGNGVAVVRGRRALHIREVLRAEPGAIVRVGVLEGPAGCAEVARVGREEVELRCRLNTDTPPRPPVDILLALPRPKVMRRLWAQLAAMGVGRILLTNAWKVERNYFDTHILKPEFYRPLLIEGLQQAQDTRLPEVSIHKQFKVLLEDELSERVPDSMRIVADPCAGASVRGTIHGCASRILLAVGPEGGWTDYERDMLKAHGFKPVAMGSRAVRTDTACVALLALLQEEIRLSIGRAIPYVIDDNA